MRFHAVFVAKHFSTDVALCPLPFPRVDFQMLLQVAGQPKPFQARQTLERLLKGVHREVEFHLALCRESFATFEGIIASSLLCLLQLVPRVRPHVGVKVARQGKAFAADGALDGLFAGGVSLLVTLEGGLLIETLAANVALERLPAGVHPNVTIQAGHTRESFATPAAPDTRFFYFGVTLGVGHVTPLLGGMGQPVSVQIGEERKRPGADQAPERLLPAGVGPLVAPGGVETWEGRSGRTGRTPPNTPSQSCRSLDSRGVNTFVAQNRVFIPRKIKYC